MGGPGILDQFQTARCEGFAHASGFTLGAAIRGWAMPLRSPDALYTMGRIVGSYPAVDGQLLELQDNGTEPSPVLQAAQTWGVPSATDWGPWPSDPARVNDPPNLAQLESASNFRLKGAYFLTSTGEQFCRDVMTALAAGFVCTGAIAASGVAFEAYRGGVLGFIGTAIDHATLWVDYEWDGTNIHSLVIYGVNSWGTDWGEDDADVGGGMYRANAEFLQSYTQDCAVLDVTGVA
jgi:hypothetical protein